VLVACAGLDHARRGFETFARECFAALSGEPGIELELVKGSGPRGERERSVPTLRRDRPIARATGRVLGARPFRIEALAFAFSLQPLIARRRPDLIYLSEWDTARGLAALRALTRQRFRLLLCNGTFAASGFEHLDHVQELTPAALEYVLARGADPLRHTVLQLGFRIDRELDLPSADERASLRARLGLPRDRSILISVAALNRSHKRLDYVIDEVAGLDAPRPFLVLVGEPDAETRALRALALDRLGADGHAFRTVPAAEVPDLLRASDAFVLGSLDEAQGRAPIEAAARGLPCFVHDSGVMRFALGDSGHYGDFSKRGALSGALRELRPPDPDLAREAHRHVYEQFAWERLRPLYVKLLRAVAFGGPRPGQAGRAKSTVSSPTGENVSR
jgi:glycosyltransferase involved in cell wall biosynthesis